MQGTPTTPQTETKVGDNLFKDQYGRLYRYVGNSKFYQPIENNNFHIHTNKGKNK